MPAVATPIRPCSDGEAGQDSGEDVLCQGFFHIQEFNPLWNKTKKTPRAAVKESERDAGQLVWRWIRPLKEFTCGCLQPASAGRWWGGRRQPIGERTPASTVTPRVAFLSPGSAGSSTTPPSPPKAQSERWRRCSQTPTCTTSPATWRSTFPKRWAYRAP